MGKKACENSMLLPFVNKTQLSTMLSLESTLLRHSQKYAKDVVEYTKVYDFYEKN